LTLDLTHFKGIVRLFPLPDLVMYPHVMQPLNVFEPRYRDLLNAALDSDGLIAMSMLVPGWESDYEGRPAVFPFACLGKVVTHQRQENGHYNILLLGTRRIRILEELPPRRTFREAKVDVLDDFVMSENDPFRDDLQAELSQRFQDTLPSGQTATPAVSQLLSGEIPLSVLTDLVSFALPIDLKTKCKLLAESDVDRRATMLLKAINAQGEPKPKRKATQLRTKRFGKLPPFSPN
jgi:ATP-dependent Lon protease